MTKTTTPPRSTRMICCEDGCSQSSDCPFQDLETSSLGRSDRFPRGWWLIPLLGLSLCVQLAIVFGRYW